MTPQEVAYDTAGRIQLLLKLVQEMHQYCLDPEFDPNTFAKQMKTFTGWYNRTDHCTQSVYHDEWVRWLCTLPLERPS